jgi:hypothetical protein
MPDRAYSSDAFNRLPFRDQLEALYGISARERRDLIVASPNALRLVRSFAAESLFHTLKEVGLEDSTDLLALASGEQVCAFVDLDCWKKDRLAIATLLDWLEALIEAGGRAIGEFLNSIDRDLLVLLLKRFVRVHRRDDPEEPEEDLEGQEIFELDEHYQIVFHAWDARAPLVRQLIEALYERDYSYFVTVAEQIGWGVDSELEEASFRLRNARLQDRGFPDYFEAQQIYRPLVVKDLAPRSQPLGETRPDDPDAVPQHRSLVMPESGESFFAQVLNASFSGEAATELQQELAYLVNRVLVADGVDFADREQVAEKIRMAHDAVNLALESSSGVDVRAAGRLLEHHYVQHLFRVAWGILLELRRSAKRTVEAVGFEATASGLAFLDTPHREALSGMLRPKPQYFFGIDRPGEIHYRAFATLRDVEAAESLIADVASLSDVCPAIVGQTPAQLAALRSPDADDFRMSAVLLTGFARFVLDGVPSIEPLGAKDLAALREETRDSETRKLRADVRERFFATLPPNRGYVEFALSRFDDEFLAIAPGRPVDPRFVTCLMLRTTNDAVRRSRAS